MLDPSLNLNHHLTCRISGLPMSPSMSIHMTRRCHLVPLTSQIKYPHHPSPQNIYPTSYGILTSSLLPISMTTPSTWLLSSVSFTMTMHHVSPHPSQYLFYISITSDYKLIGGALYQLQTAKTAYIHIGRSHHKIGGIGDSILCTGKWIFHLLCKDGLLIPITIFYCPDATKMIISATDAIFSNSDSFDSWWKMANCSTGGSELKFYKSNGITTCSVSLLIQNKLWYLEHDVIFTVYCAKIRSSSDTFVRVITGSTLHNLWQPSSLSCREICN